ncbi:MULTISPECIES: TetR/AcrR family transcriptional regulator [Bacillus]|uniref:TetR family transcriptional regulator n=2 Tax=Bacillus TaxID=1386 RepID=A0A0M4GC28_9BACI|nr:MULTISPECIES: TetR/AcrR family transcriptional regulator [Bacillus]ALC83428.1 TetR family transcriptional regulator [Bacillus gobiensis]MBP1082366.1 AcrR family transcriptional regulator [Bacillus capparidis]MED1097375.1 TetR/AcrR family transcriptional regulator [Bacillus capparidis]
MGTATKTDRRILKTKAAINKAFLELFSEKEFDRITINDISERADVNRGTVYLHYTDKYDLLNKCIKDHLDKMILSCTFTKFMQKKGNQVEAIEAMKSLFIYFEENFLFFSSMLSNPKTSTFRECMLKIITTTIQEKLDMQGINQGMDNELITQYTASAFVGTVEWWILNHMPRSPQFMAEHTWKLFERNNICS